MDLAQVNAKIRPRNHYEAIDLGFVMARHWLPTLYSLWFCVSFPLFIILQIIFSDSPYISAVVIWWIKPLLDSIQLHYISEKLFSNNVNFKQTLKQAPRRLWKSALIKLTIRRPSLSRSFDMPVDDLENLKGAQRSKRLNVLQRSASSAAIWLTFVGITMENIVVFAFCGLAWMFTPPQLDIYIEFWELIAHPEVHRILSWCWYLAMGLIAPFYVTAGFSLYINRRTVLEGWDIELSFKDMATRAKTLQLSPLTLCLTIFLVIATSLPSTSYATQTTAQKLENTDSAPLGELISDLLPHDAQQRMIVIVESDTFNDIRNKEEWKLINPIEETEEQNELSPWLADIFSILAQGTEVILWGIAILCVLFIILRLKGFEVPFLEAKKYARPPPPTSLFGLELNQNTLPEDIISAAKDFWRRSPRQALSLLYRAALSDLVHAETLPLHSSHTEGECVRLFNKKTHSNPKSLFFQTLTEQWVMLAYGHQRVTHKQFDALCDEWPEHFPFGSSDKTSNQYVPEENSGAPL